MNKGFIIFLFGPSGTGKDCIEKSSGLKRKPITVTNRMKRKNEIDGFDYHFWSDSKIRENDDNFYIFDYYAGVFKGELIDELEESVKLINNGEILIRQATNTAVKKLDNYFKSRGIETKKVLVISLRHEIIERMRRRGENEETINKRVKSYLTEMRNGIDIADDILLNKEGKLNDCIEEFKLMVNDWKNIINNN